MTSSLEAWGSKVFLVKHFNYLKKSSNFPQLVTPAQAYKCCAWHVIWFLLFHLLFSFHIQLVCSREEHQWGPSLLEKLWMNAETNRKQICHITPRRNPVNPSLESCHSWVFWHYHCHNDGKILCWISSSYMVWWSSECCDPMYIFVHMWKTSSWGDV